MTIVVDECELAPLRYHPCWQWIISYTRAPQERRDRTNIGQRLDFYAQQVQAPAIDIHAHKGDRRKPQKTCRVGRPAKAFDETAFDQVEIALFRWRRIVIVPMVQNLPLRRRLVLVMARTMLVLAGKMIVRARMIMIMIVMGPIIVSVAAVQAQTFQYFRGLSIRARCEPSLP